jgi:hypothetical protein
MCGVIERDALTTFLQFLSLSIHFIPIGKHFTRLLTAFQVPSFCRLCAAIVADVAEDAMAGFTFDCSNGVNLGRELSTHK